MPEQIDRARRTFAMLGHDQLGGVGRLAGVVIGPIAIEEQDDVAVLLDRARVSEITQHRPLVHPLLYGPTQLRSHDDGHIQFPRQILQALRQRGHFLIAVLTAAIRCHQLQIIDDDQSQLPFLAMKASGAGAQVVRAKIRAVVDK